MKVKAPEYERADPDVPCRVCDLLLEADCTCVQVTVRWQCTACKWVHDEYNVPHMPPEKPLFDDDVYLHDVDPTFRWRRRPPQICYGMMKRI